MSGPALLNQFLRPVETCLSRVSQSYNSVAPSALPAAPFPRSGHADPGLQSTSICAGVSVHPQADSSLLHG